MEKKYNDFKLIEEEKILSVFNEYNKKLDIVKISNVSEEHQQKLTELFYNLKKSQLFLDGLIRKSQNKQVLTILQEIKDEIVKINSELFALFELDNEYFDEKFNVNSFNKKELSNCLLDFLQTLFYFLENERNIKMQSVLKNIFKKLIEILKEINGVEVEKMKIFTLFKRY